MGVSSDILEKSKIFLEDKNKIETYIHCKKVGDFAGALASDFQVDEEKAKIAGYLHDISAIYPIKDRVCAAEAMGINLLEEEIQFPLIIHQKISKKIAEDVFNITDTEVLSAIECHTTLKADYSKLDLVLFVADKICWDQEGHPPYLDGLLNSLHSSLEEAALFYIEYVLNHDIKVIHPWLRGAQISLTNGKKALQ